MPEPLKSVLIANRGEIALRVIRACKEMGIRSVLVYSEADADSLPVKEADQAVCIGPGSVNASYRNAQAVISAALAYKVDAIHPGYGFLSENPDFVRMCEEEGVGFVGPASHIIKSMGDKIEAKIIARRAGVPTVPGSLGAISEYEEARTVADEVGFPMLIKAAAGGGGRGMRVVQTADTLEKDLREIMSEAEVAFGDPSVYIERYLTDIRHIEIQVISDGETVLHVGERDCTAQRRNQKLVEEAPSPVLDAELRDGLAAAAVALCKEVGYTNAGTVEFVFDNVDRKYYFIEMNTRIQVEHPVSEMISGIDLIKLQLQIAGGTPIGMTQEDVVIRGHAIECRINAEDPENDFAPDPGRIVSFRAPGGFGVRMDTHIESGYVIPPYYDSMIGKLICWGRDREEAVARALRALDELEVEGIVTTAAFQKEILDSERFRSGDFNTAYVGQLMANRHS
ncbi:acetyl-CoA carboxylase biotin carboxylase subunit [Cnuibacter physcomitrellae]|uniref:Biotin carboxylase n=1 Tax=Cnuibacter physcomitrellae TaxID=1619308 RepID=A0A1X9LR83_9MICO|nr:acetyl-CoA carboxylase biotin carboxylase subunit [Cnuibacter physcomitrellae]ARJ07695.1 acetyl-CoA carboxylase biotin carboxylase subunit [Cnuibacter physcomitrellae]GGI42580.1 acetyl-CoA carboxylase biotin carboxylase subunit [Cnuibacter physcomitrellae]